MNKLYIISEEDFKKLISDPKYPKIKVYDGKDYINVNVFKNEDNAIRTHICIHFNMLHTVSIPEVINGFYSLGDNRELKLNTLNYGDTILIFKFDKDQHKVRLMIVDEVRYLQ